MKINKILNNNAVMVKEADKEKIVVGSGVGFQKRKNDLINPKAIEKIFILKENEKFEQLLMRIPEVHFILSEEIISYAENQLETRLNDHIHLALTDHLSFAIERERKGIYLKNKLLPEIEVLYKEEFEIGLWAIQHIQANLGIEMSIDEAAFIALHIHTMKIRGGDLKETVKQTAVVREMVDMIEQYLEGEISRSGLAYERLVTHLYYMLDRVGHHGAHALDQEMLAMIKKKYVTSYSCSQQVTKKVANVFGIDFPEEELGYVTLHIERLRMNLLE